MMTKVCGVFLCSNLMFCNYCSLFSVTACIGSLSDFMAKWGVHSYFDFGGMFLMLSLMLKHPYLAMKLHGQYVYHSIGSICMAELHVFVVTCMLPDVDVPCDVETSYLSIFDLLLKFSCIWYAFEVLLYY